MDQASAGLLVLRLLRAFQEWIGVATALIVPEHGRWLLLERDLGPTRLALGLRGLRRVSDEGVALLELEHLKRRGLAFEGARVCIQQRVELLSASFHI